MGFKKMLQRLLALLILGGALVFGMSGVYHEAPWILKPLFGSVKVELGGKRVSANTDHVKAVIRKSELEQLEYLTNLKSADFRGSTCYREIAAWSEAHPEVTVLYSVPLPNGQMVDNNVQELDLTWMSSADVKPMRDTLTCLPDVRVLRFGEVGGGKFSLQDMQEIRMDCRQAEFYFNAVIDGRVYDGEATSLDLRDARREDMQALTAVLMCMNRLESVELGSESTGNIAWEDIAIRHAQVELSECPVSLQFYALRQGGRPRHGEARLPRHPCLR